MLASAGASLSFRAPGKPRKRNPTPSSCTLRSTVATPSPAMPVLRVNIVPSCQVSVPDALGRHVDFDKSPTFNVRVTNELEIGSASIFFNVVVPVPRDIGGSRKDADALAIGWLKAALPARLATATFWNFFHTMQLTLEGGEAVPDDTPHHPLEANIELTPELASRATEAMQHLQAVRAAFEASRRRLSDSVRENYAAGFKQSSGTAARDFYVIEQVLDASADMGFDGGPREVRAAAEDYRRLGERKDMNHPNYKNIHASLTRAVYGFNFPTTWATKPPIPAQ